MHITPTISNDPTATAAQGNSTPTRRATDSQSPTAQDTLDLQTNLPAAVPEATDLDFDVADTHAADHIMNSLRTGILSQPGEAMLAQANLPPQSVYDLLQ